MSIPREVLKIVRDRAQGNCEICLTGLAEDEGSPHHRLLKSHGGKDTVSNLILIHHKCHMDAHANPKRAMLHGWIVPSWATPLDYPLHMAGNLVVRLDEQGNYEQIEGKAWQE
jgi:hypothetical protein